MMAGLRPRRVVGRPEDAAPDEAAVLRYLGFRPGRTRMTPGAQAAVAAGMAAALPLLAPRAALVDCAVVPVPEDGGPAENGGGLGGAGGVGTGHGAAAGAGSGPGEVALACGVRWRSRTLAQVLAGARAVTVVVATVGAAIEAEVARRFQAGEYAEATVVDAVGTAAVHAWLSRLCRDLAAQVEPHGLTLSPPYSPGYGDWPITDLPALLELAGADLAGVGCNEACYLVPQKSVVAVVGWLDPAGARPAPVGCAACTYAGCRYRQAPARAAAAGVAGVP